MGSIGKRVENEGKATKIIWVCSKDFLTNRRIQLQKVDISRPGSAAVQKARRALRKLNFSSGLLLINRTKRNERQSWR